VYVLVTCEPREEGYKLKGLPPAQLPSDLQGKWFALPFMRCHVIPSDIYLLRWTLPSCKATSSYRAHGTDDLDFPFALRTGLNGRALQSCWPAGEVWYKAQGEL
jgi:hypothetical protein